MKPVAKKVNKKTVKKKVSSKNLDKFYTHPDIAKMFVDIINKLTPLEKFDMIIEPSAGSGNILKFLPNKTLGLCRKSTIWFWLYESSSKKVF